MPGIDPRDPRQPYEQIADHIRSEIKAGNLRPGGRVPSGRDLAANFGVAHQTAAHALRVLKDEGLIMSWSGRGAIVRDEALETLKASTANPDEAFNVIMTRLDEVESKISRLTNRVSKLEQTRRRQER